MKVKTAHEMRAAGLSYEDLTSYRRKVQKAIDTEATDMLVALESLLEGKPLPEIKDNARAIIERIQAKVDKVG